MRWRYCCPSARSVISKLVRQTNEPLVQTSFYFGVFCFPRCKWNAPDRVDICHDVTGNHRLTMSSFSKRTKGMIVTWKFYRGQQRHGNNWETAQGQVGMKDRGWIEVSVATGFYLHPTETSAETLDCGGCSHCVCSGQRCVEIVVLKDNRSSCNTSLTIRNKY